MTSKLEGFEWVIKSQGHTSLKIECPFLSDFSDFLGPNLQQHVNDESRYGRPRAWSSMKPIFAEKRISFSSELVAL